MVGEKEEWEVEEEEEQEEQEGEVGRAMCRAGA